AFLIHAATSERPSNADEIDRIKFESSLPIQCSPRSTVSYARAIDTGSVCLYLLKMHEAHQASWLRSVMLTLT
ncbi:hypothetical protein L9F63_002538, partial [Diploptera punctata]